jgi:GTPase involved in cell partitioning and DNA repair
VYVVDGSGYDERRPSSDLTVLIKELRHHDRLLMGKPSVVFLNKMDVEGIQAHCLRQYHSADIM